MPRYSFTKGDYSGTGWSETGEENKQAERDVDPEIQRKVNEIFRRRGYPEKYQREETPVREEPLKKLEPVRANYRPAFSAARCGLCVHFQAGSQTCELVADAIDENSVCDLYTPRREDATEAANRLFGQ